MNLFNPPPIKKPEPITRKPAPMPVKLYCGCHHTGYKWQRCNQGATLLLKWMADLQNIEKRNNYFLHYNQTK